MSSRRHQKGHIDDINKNVIELQSMFMSSRGDQMGRITGGVDK